MQPGKLRHKVLIEKYAVTRTAEGEATKAWSTHKTVWSKIEQATGRELINAADSMEGRITHKLLCRALDAEGVTVNMRINWESESRIFAIKVPPLADRTNEKFFNIMCEEIATENDGIS